MLALQDAELVSTEVLRVAVLTATMKCFAPNGRFPLTNVSRAACRSAGVKVLYSWHCTTV